MINSKIAIIGSGALGSALGTVLIDSGYKNLVIYGIDNDELSDLSNGKNTKYFQEITLPKFKTTNDLTEALNGASYVVLAVPTIAIDKILNQIIEQSNSNFLIINGCKGFYPNTSISVHVGIEEKIKNNQKIRGCVSVLGPSFAKGIVEKNLTSICSISQNNELANEVKKMFKTDYFKLHVVNDVIGAEVGSIYKNVLAIGSGMLKEAGYKINTIASYLTFGLNEMLIFNEFKKGKNETIIGLTGLGDLILTATDDNSRNYTFGKEFIRDKTKALNSKETLEGLKALEVLEQTRKENNLDLPIVKNLYSIIYNDKDIHEAIKSIFI